MIKVRLNAVLVHELMLIEDAKLVKVDDEADTFEIRTAEFATKKARFYTKTDACVKLGISAKYISHAYSRGLGAAYGDGYGREHNRDYVYADHVDSLIKPATAAQILGVSVVQIHRLIEAQTLGVVKFGPRTFRIWVQDVNEYLQKRLAKRTKRV